METLWEQTLIHLPAHPRGFHLITVKIEQVLASFPKIQTGMLWLLLQHTSASLTLNENADPQVRRDLKYWLGDVVAENKPYYSHVDEGADDMPAHIKSSLLGTQLAIPIAEGRLALGTWQGIYLGEHRESAPARRILMTIHGMHAR